MSDVPWAVAWYGQRQCVWLTLNAQDDFFAINDYLKPVQALYLTPETMDAKFASDWMYRAGESQLGQLCPSSGGQGKIPTGFPLVQSPPGLFPERLFLTRCGSLETAEINSARAGSELTRQRVAAGRQCHAIPAIPAALPPQSIPRPPRHSGAIPRKWPARTPRHRAESRSPARNFRRTESGVRNDMAG